MSETGTEARTLGYSPGLAAPEADYPDERRVIVFTGLGHGMMHVFELLYAGVLPLLILQFDLTLTQAGMLVFPNLLMLGLGSLPAGLLADRWDSQRVFLLFFFGTSLATGLVGFCRTTWQLAAAFGLMGLCASMYHPTGLAMISLGVRRQGLVMGLHGVFGSLGLAISPFLAGFFGEMLGWQWAFFIPAAVGLVIGFGLLFFPIKSLSRSSLAARRNDHPPPDTPGTRRVLIWLYAVMLVTGFVYRGLMTYLPKYIGDRLQVSWITSAVVVGGLFVSLILVVGGVGQIWGGHMSDRRDPFRVYVRLVPFLMPLLLATSLLKGYPMVLGLCVFQFFFFATQPMENQMLAAATPAHYRSTGYGIKFGLNLGVGSLAAPLCGLIGDMFGMDWIFYTLSLVLLLTAAGAVMMRRAYLKMPAGL
ncbi:MAG: MFS transporter [Candidatus Glassbacteria bacterium]|nr:MFS transporter [Candidatus Glassbacteria bacterium]